MGHENPDPLAGLHECPWCGAPPSPCSTCLECVHEPISVLLREESDQVVSALAKGGGPAREWHSRMSQVQKTILSPFTPGDVASVAGLAWARRLEAGCKDESVVAVVAVVIGLLVMLLVVTMIARLS